MEVRVLFYYYERKLFVFHLAKGHNVEQHFTTHHESYHANYSPGSVLWAERARELKAVLDKSAKKITKSNQSLI